MRSTFLLALAATTVSAALPSIAFARGCRERGDVEYEHCRRHRGDHAVKQEVGLTFETSISYAWLDPKGRNISGSFGKGQPGDYHYSGSIIGHDLSALPLTLRFGYAFTSWIYGGAELEVGAGSDELPGTTASGYRISPSSEGGINAVMAGAGGYAGLRLPLSYFTVRGETLFGGRMVGVNQDARSLASGQLRTAGSTLGAAIIEPRLLLDFWLERTTTVSIYAGFNALHPSDGIGGLMIGLHGRRYDGGVLFL
jgi:hypothetical protein